MDHHHLVVQATVRRPVTDPQEGVVWIEGLLRRLEMTLMLPPQGAYSDMLGNRGLTVVALITTSHIAMHFWDEPSPAELQLDVYSCKPYRKEVVFEAIKEAFSPLSIRYKFIDRQRNLTLFDESILDQSSEGRPDTIPINNRLQTRGLEPQFREV